MKRTLVGIVLAGLYATASAQGYAGVLSAMSDYDFDCKNVTPCDKKGKGFKIYAGTHFKEGLVDTEYFKIDTLEVGFIRFGGINGASTGNVSYTYLDDQDFEQTTVQPTRASGSASAMTLAGVGRFLIGSRLSISAKLGVAYVASTIDRQLGTSSNGSKTSLRLQPYAGAGIEVSILENLKIVGAIDYTKFASDGYKGDLQSVGIGAELGF